MFNKKAVLKTAFFMLKYLAELNQQITTELS